MSFLTRLLLALCVFAGMANGMVHKNAYHSGDDCAEQHSHGHGHTHDNHGDEGDKDAPHHHNCCHSPTACFPLEMLSVTITFRPSLIEIATDGRLAPEEPVFALDKPPLI